MKFRLRTPGHDVCLKIMSRTITTQGLSYQSYRETHCNARLDVKSWQSQRSGKSSQGQGSSYVLEEYSKDNYYALLDTRIYHYYRETHLNAKLYIKSWQNHSSMKYRSWVSDHSVCLKSMSRTITMQGLTLTAITSSEKYTLLLQSTCIILHVYLT